MRCPTLAELPAPPPGKEGWPWTQEGPRLPHSLPGGAPWPRISVVTPSFNQGEFIEETIRSVLLQGYPDLQYIIIDGGSTDGTVDIIGKYEQWLDFWTSEPDQGQSDAINKGLERATGQVLAYLNSDDIYLPGALGTVGRAFADPAVQWASGRCRLLGRATRGLATLPRRPWRERWRWLVRNCIFQPSTFWRREVADQVGPFSTDLHLLMDYEYWLRMVAAGHSVTWMDAWLSGYRLHRHSKTRSYDDEFWRESEMVRARHMAMLTAGERRKVQRAVTALRGRRLRWQAWREARAGEPVASLSDLGAAMRASPRLLLSPRTAAALLLALFGLLCLKPLGFALRLLGGSKASR
ncbi:MAG: glycosyltransferase [Candidatus Brocadiae bacterium]|nr:glycosyltransferase [Candidatus Brocadiia bacterium]